MNGEVLFYLLLQLLIPCVISHSDNCLDFDIDELDDYLSALNLTAVPTVEVMIAGFQCPITTLPFGALKSDWSRLLLLYQAQARESPLKHKLRRLFRILVIAFYQMEERFEPAKGIGVQPGGSNSSTSSVGDATTVGYLSSHQSNAWTTSTNFNENNTISIKHLYGQTASSTDTNDTLSYHDSVTDTIYKSTEGTKSETTVGESSPSFSNFHNSSDFQGISSEATASWARGTVFTNPTDLFTNTKINLTNARKSTEDSAEDRLGSTAGAKVYQNTVQLMNNNISSGSQIFITPPITTSGDYSTPRTKIQRGDAAIFYPNYGVDEDGDDKGQSTWEEKSTSTTEYISVSSLHYDDSTMSEKSQPSTGESTVTGDLLSGINVGDNIERTIYEISSESSSSTIISPTVSSWISSETTAKSPERNNSDLTGNIAVTLPTLSGETSTQSTDVKALTTINDDNGKFNERLSAGTTLPDSHERTSSFMYPLLNYPDPSLNSVYKIYLDESPSLDPALMGAEENGSYQTVQHKIKRPQIVKEPENPASKHPLVSWNFVAHTTSTEPSLVSGASSTEREYRTSLLRSQKRESLNLDTENQYRWFFKLAEQQGSGKDKSADTGIVRCQPEE